MFKSFSPIVCYLFILLFIGGWWGLTIEKKFLTSSIPSSTLQNLSLSPSSFSQELTTFHRNTLKTALSGNVDAMLTLIDQWQTDAYILRSQGIQNIYALPTDIYQQAHQLARVIKQFSKQDLCRLNQQISKNNLQINLTHSIDFTSHTFQFLPQSYMATSFLLAIAPTHELIAFPRGLRSLPQLYSPTQLEQVSEHIENLSNEKLYTKHPDLAFVASYSNPMVLENLKKLTVPFHLIHYQDTFGDISKALLEIGQMSHHILEAQLLVIFLDACFKTIDNRLTALQKFWSFSQDTLTLLYLAHRQTYTLPTTKCLAGKLIQRALGHCPHFVCTLPKNSQVWSYSVDCEYILQNNPDCLIFSTPLTTHGHYEGHHPLAFNQLKAMQQDKVFYLDEAIQSSPTQYIALAYFDLYQALVKAHNS